MNKCVHAARPARRRLDALLVDMGLVETRTKAHALIMAGKVIVDGTVVDKPGKEIKEGICVELKEGMPYVGRGGVKLAGALDEFNIAVKGLVAMDVGSSTGGFTDCLLKRGAAFVYAVDVGKGILDYKLRNDARVCVLEERNIRGLEFSEVGRKVDIIVVDVSFISLEKALPNVREFVKDDGAVLALIKPQFEVGKGEVGKGGIVKDPKKHCAVVERITAFSVSAGFKFISTCPSPITGAKGNKEFWIYLKNRDEAVTVNRDRK
ncbi:MAG: TlyA family RNA methyltransferase [Deltaproteobacteria bacterium]|nr:TlyA family RNA methyltransferase [Deltaproteobacteria bacterium]